MTSLKRVSDEVVDRRTGIAYTERTGYEGDHLTELKSRRVQAERKNILLLPCHVVGRKLRDVAGIIEKAFSFQSDETGVVLTETLQARAPRGYDVGTKVSAP